MSLNRIRLAMGILFLLLAVFILLRGWLAPGLDARFDSTRLWLGGLLALVFAGLNFARWYSMYAYQQARRTAVRTPLQPDPSATAPEPPNPDLDFTKDEKQPG